MKKHYRDENDCLNCGANLQGKYCHVCGQENLQLKENFGHVMSHAISDYFHFDHHFFHTFKPLLFNPGHLTNEYMAGRRVQYLHPIKMYIFISLVYFLMLFSPNGREAVKSSEDNKGGKQDLSAVAMQKKDDGKIDIMYTQKNDTLLTSTGYTSYKQYLENQQKRPADKRDGLLERYFNKKAIAWKEKGGNISKKLFGESIKHHAPKLMFILLPLFALFLKITFRKNRKYYVEHLIFSIHLHCFLFLFLILIMIIKMVIPNNWDKVEFYLDMFVFLSIAVYLYQALRTVYHRSILRTISKLFGLMIAYIFSFGISLFLLVIVAAIFTL